MSDAKPPTRILVPTDLSADARGALRYAVAMAQSAGGAEIFLLHVLRNHQFDDTTALDRSAEQVQQLEAARAREIEDEAARQAAPEIQLHPRTAWARAVYDGILQFVEEESVDIIVMGTRGRTGLSYVVLGSVTEKVVEHARCPVLVVKEDAGGFLREDGTIRLERILFPTDRSRQAEVAVPVARDVATRQQAEILVAHVVPPGPLDEEQRADFDRRARSLFEGYPKVSSFLTQGSVAKGLLEVAAAHEVDLIVMASAGRDSLGDRLLGSVAQRVLRLADCPVCVVK